MFWGYYSNFFITLHGKKWIKADISFSVENESEELSTNGSGNRNPRRMIYWNRNAWNDVAWNECLEIKARRNLVMQQTRKGSLILNILNTVWQCLSHYIPVSFCCPHSWDRDHVLFSSKNPLHLAKALVCRAPLVAQKIKNPHAMQETWVWSRFHLGWEDPLEKEIYLLQDSRLENSTNRGAWQATVPRGHKEWDITAQLTLSLFFGMITSFCWVNKVIYE